MGRKRSKGGGGGGAGGGGGGKSRFAPFRSIPDLLTLGAGDLSRELVQSCEAAYKLQRAQGESFWLPAGAAPACGLEVLAAAIYNLHTAVRAAGGGAKEVAAGGRDGAGAGAAVVCSGKEGAEWWVQIRGGESPDGEAIGFHWDRYVVCPPPTPPTVAR
jgi:hypothetical protein